MRRANIVSGVVLALFGLVMLVAVIPLQIEHGPPDMVSPRLVPNMMMVVDHRAVGAAGRHQPARRGARVRGAD